MFPVPASLDYQTVFQIVATFEGFSVWKGAKAFKADGKADIGVGMPENFDNATFAAHCDALKNGPDKGREFFRIGWMLLKAKLADSRDKIRHLWPVWFWQSIRFLHKCLVFVLCATPIITIPLLSLSFLFQIGCESNDFGGVWIAICFIIAKTGCYGVCFVLATMLSHHVKVDVPASDGKNIIEQ